MENQERDALARNLKDAGCGPELIRRCLLLAADQRPGEEIRLLRSYRLGLLEGIHTEQKKLDRLDHLLYQLEKAKA